MRREKIVIIQAIIMKMEWNYLEGITKDNHFGYE